MSAALSPNCDAAPACGKSASLLRGEVNVRRMATAAGLRLLLHVQSRAREPLRLVHVRLPNDLGWELMQVAKRGVDSTLVFAGGEPGLELLRLQGGRDLDRLGERCRIHTIESAGHAFSRSASKMVLEQALSEALLTQRAPRSAAT
jgi:hypothetical protein